MEKEVYKLLERLNITYTKIEHPPLITSSDKEKYNLNFDTLICKNLLIKNSNESQYYVVILPIEKKINFKTMQKSLLETRLSFVDEKTLEEKLGVKKGSVSIFNIISQKSNDIIYILDEDILKYDSIGFHPNINSTTVIFSPNEIGKIFNTYNIKYKFIAI